MSNLLKQDKKGFTLIEIVLVLAIAGLIMVIVLLAVSGAQKSRRDTQRKNDLNRVAGQLISYASNNNGVYPTVAEFSGATFAGSTYITTLNLNSPSTGSPYAYNGSGATPPLDTISYTVAGRTFTICMGLEQGVVCRTDN